MAQEDTGEESPHLMDDDGVALSGMMYGWAQFIDHDLDLQKQGTITDISITVAADDEFLPAGSIIPLVRVAIDPATGVAGIPQLPSTRSQVGWMDRRFTDPTLPPQRACGPPTVI
ncbi:hypothetical protein [Bradyrhizobium elkanii]|uniref:hypothetical protein n=1 Tax=Bradyrhizobium elkanii TaxID=29448 RepID=UPI000424D446|nr:hypothetical protein [Bradyrhizobium elkanii]